MVREAWNEVHPVHKQVFQGTNLRKQFSRENGKSLLALTTINYINWITGKTFHKLQIWAVFDLDNCVLYQS